MKMRITDPLQPGEDGRTNIWYISAGHKGFTSDPEMAMKDLTGAAILCPGALKSLIGLIERDHDKIMNMHMGYVQDVWEELLDQMEQYSDMVERKFGNKSGLAEFDLDCANSRAEMLGVAKALALLERGNQYETEPDLALAEIRRMAEVKYDMSVEE